MLGVVGYYLPEHITDEPSVNLHGLRIVQCHCVEFKIVVLVDLQASTSWTRVADLPGRLFFIVLLTTFLQPMLLDHRNVIHSRPII